MDEAVRTVDVVRMERERSAMFTTITQTAMDGVLYVDIQQTIKICNPAALKMYTGPKKKLQGLSLQSAFPFLSEPVSTVISTGTELPNQLIRWKNYTINATIHPVIINSRITGIVDVYKRQSIRNHNTGYAKMSGEHKVRCNASDSRENDRFFMEPLAQCLGCHFHIWVVHWCPGPVSYTHLDVYKRQVILSFLQAQTFLLHIKNPETVLKRGNVSGFRFFNLLIISHPARHHDTP